MNRFFLAALLGIVSACSPQTKTSEAGLERSPQDAITIVLPLAVAPGADSSEAVVAMQEIGAEIRKSPGLIDERLLKGATPNVEPKYVHVMQWRSRRDWDNAVGSGALQKFIEPRLPLIRINLAEVYQPAT